MGIDTQLIDDGTYFVVESNGEVAGCGGWSRRATLYGGNQAPRRDATLLDPVVDPARVRAMYTNPADARRGVGRLILSLCEAAAAAEGFTRLELMSTLSGEPLNTAYGFQPLERLADATGGSPVPLIRMEKPIDPSLLGSHATLRLGPGWRFQNVCLSRRLRIAFRAPRLPVAALGADQKV